jgi:hypothetical protein
MDFDAIFSQSALAARLQYPLTVGVAKNRTLITTKLKRKRKTTVLSEPPSTEITCLEVPILSSDKSSNGVNVREKSVLSQEEASAQDTGPDTPASSKKQKATSETQEWETLQSPDLDCVEASSTDQLPVETPQEEICPPPGPDIAQPSLAEPSLTSAIVSSPSLRGHIPLAEDVMTGEISAQPLIASSPVNPAYLSRKTREEKGKDVARDGTSDDLAIERLKTNLSSDSMVNRAGDRAQTEP